MGVETINDYVQVYYMYNDRQIFLTTEAYNHVHPIASGQYVSWERIVDGANQIYIYDVLTGALTTAGSYRS